MSVERVMVVGLDGATWDVLAPLAEQGVMPNVARLMQTAALGELESTKPYITPVAWSTFLCGADPGVHGIWDYRFLDHRRREVLVNHAGRIPCKNLLQAVSDAGHDVVSLNLPMTWPTPSGVRGIVVGGIDAPSIHSALAPHPQFAERLRATGARFNLSTVWRHKPRNLAEVEQGVRETEADFRGRAAAAAVADAMTDWRLMIVQFQTLDSLQHRCWHLLGTDDAAKEPPAEVAAIRRAMATLDRAVGELLELASKRNAAVVVLSDHGFGPFREQIAMPELLARGGLLAWPRWQSRLTYRISRTVWKARKSWARYTGRRAGAVQRPPEALLPIDWRRSRAVTLHGNLGALVYLNTRERFGVGPLVTECDEQRALADTTAALTAARHPETNEPLFEEVFSTRAKYGQEPLERNWPDLVAIPSPGFHTWHKIDPQHRMLRADPTLVATHRLQGVLMLDGPQVHSGEPLSARLADVAPTILAWLGLTPPTSMTGRPLQQVKPAREPAAPHAGVWAAPLPASAYDAAQQAEIESRLRDLGYVD